MKNFSTHRTEAQNMPMKHRLIYAALSVLLLVGVVAPGTLFAQSSDDALTSVDQVLRYMKSANYSEEDLLNRMAWGDKLVNDFVSYRPGEDDRQNYLRLLDVAINHYQDENTRLKILLRAVTTLDPLVQKYFPQWIVQDEAMILEIMRKVRDNRDDLLDAEAVVIAERVLSGKARMRVVQSPKDPENLIAVIIEKARAKDEANAQSAGFITNLDNTDFEDYRIVGRRNLQEVLTRDLYEKVVNRREYAHLEETGAIKPQPYVAEAWISIPFGGGFMWTLESDERKGDGVAIQVSRIRAGFELKIGNDWISMPFLYGAQWNTMFVYEPSSTERIKIGPSIPFTWGDKSIEESFSLFQPRTLNGTWGATGEYHTQLSNIAGAPGRDADGIGAAAYVSFGLKTLGTKNIIDANGTIINGDGASDESLVDTETRFYNVASNACAYYWRDLGFLFDGLRLHAGLGYIKVNESTRMDPAMTGSGSTTTYDSVRVVSGHGSLDLYAKLTYDHQGKTKYGVSLQYFNGYLMGQVYLNIFSWMRAEVKYSRLVFRDKEKWELEEMIVPGITLGFAF